MTEGNMDFSSDKKEMYGEVALLLKGLFEECPHVIANLANASALLNQAMKDINWVGFYLLKGQCASKNIHEIWNYGENRKDLSAAEMNYGHEAEEEMLVLGPFQGKPACVEIKFGKGVCGTAAVRDEVMLVKNVHEFPGHIACDAASNSEIVLPIHVNGIVVGVLDIDSPLTARFDEEDKEGLGEVVRVIEEMLIFFQ